MGAIEVFVKKIVQKDAHHFRIEWEDGYVQQFKLSDLQRNCPCASCIDEFTGQKLLDPNSVDDHVKATRLMNVGRYGLRVKFTSGCSMGIYSFNMLRQMGDQQ